MPNSTQSIAKLHIGTQVQQGPIEVMWPLYNYFVERAASLEPGQRISEATGGKADSEGNPSAIFVISLHRDIDIWLEIPADENSALYTQFMNQLSATYDVLNL